MTLYRQFHCDQTALEGWLRLAEVRADSGDGIPCRWQAFSMRVSRGWGSPGHARLAGRLWLQPVAQPAGPLPSPSHNAATAPYDEQWKPAPARMESAGRLTSALHTRGTRADASRDVSTGLYRRFRNRSARIGCTNALLRWYHLLWSDGCGAPDRHRRYSASAAHDRKSDGYSRGPSATAPLSGDHDAPAPPVRGQP